MASNMGSMRILIKGGKVVNDDFTQEADVYIENGIIQQVTYINTQHVILFICHIKMDLTQILNIHDNLYYIPYFRKLHSTVPTLTLWPTHSLSSISSAVSVTHFTIIQYEETLWLCTTMVNTIINSQNVVMEISIGLCEEDAMDSWKTHL